jgi:excisionase family DNA binding protein
MTTDHSHGEVVPPSQKGSSSLRLSTPVFTNSAQASGVGASSLPALVDIETVSQALGISTRQVRRFVAQSQIPFVRVGHLIRFDPNELSQWLDARRSGSVQAVG